MGKKLKIDSEASGKIQFSSSDIQNHVSLLLKSKKNLNSILDLFRYFNSTDAKLTVMAIHGLIKVFESLISKGDLDKIKLIGNEAPENIAITWLQGNLSSFLSLLCKNLAHDSQRVQIACIRGLFDILRAKSIRADAFDGKTLMLILESILSVSTNDEEENQDVDGSNSIHDLLGSLYLNVFPDLRYFAYKCIPKLCKRFSTLNTETRVTFLHNLHVLMMNMETEPVENETSTENFLIYKNNQKEAKQSTSSKKHILVFSEAWLSFLRLPLSSSMHKEVLSIVQDKLIPHMFQPVMLHGFLTSSYDMGGTTSLLALHGLFILITKHNLDYPHFFPKLYAILNEEIMELKYRPQFLRLLDMFLKSPYLPSYLVSSFLKRMARICLASSASVILGFLPIMHNLIRRHQSCVRLLHRELEFTNNGKEEESYHKVTETLNDIVENIASESVSDPFDANETNMEYSKAMESCLWELIGLKDHFHPIVSDYAKKFQTPFEKKQIQQDTQKYLFETYRSLFEKATEKPPRESTRLAYEKPTGSSIFVEGGIAKRYWNI